MDANKTKLSDKRTTLTQTSKNRKEGGRINKQKTTYNNNEGIIKEIQTIRNKFTKKKRKKKHTMNSMNGKGRKRRDRREEKEEEEGTITTQTTRL